MFCSQCGAQIADNADFCPSCGASVVTVSSTPYSAKISVSGGIGSIARYTKSLDLKDPKVMGIAAVAAVVVVVLLFSILFGGQSYKKAVGNYVESIFDADGKQFLSTLPDKVVKAIGKDFDMSKRELANYIDEELEDFTDELEYYYGDNYSVKHKIIDTDKYDTDDLKWIKRSYKELGINVKDAMIVTVRLNIRAGGMTESEEIEVGVIKVGNSWYVDFENSDMPF